MKRLEEEYQATRPLIAWFGFNSGSTELTPEQIKKGVMMQAQHQGPTINSTHIGIANLADYRKTYNTATSVI